MNKGEFRVRRNAEPLFTRVITFFAGISAGVRLSRTYLEITGQLTFTGDMDYHVKIRLLPPKLKIKKARRDPAVPLWAAEDDVWICSYPKSGNTWMRFCLANLLRPAEAVDFRTVNDLIPDIYRLNRGNFSNGSRSRYLKSHEVFRPDYRRVLYLCRDPRDVLVSYFHYSRKQEDIADDMTIAEFAEIFLEGTIPARSAGSWAENVGSWLGARRASKSFLMLRYEDLLANPHARLAQAARFLGIPFTDEMIAGAIEASAADRMRAIEAREADSDPALRKRRDIPFVRKATSGGWRKELPAPVARKVEQRWAPLMRELGYLN